MDAEVNQSRQTSALHAYEGNLKFQKQKKHSTLEITAKGIETHKQKIKQNQGQCPLKYKNKPRLN